MIIAIDFDETIVKKDSYKELPGAFQVIKKLQEMGHNIILWTCRAGQSLQNAVDYCKENGVVFDAVNQNLQGFDSFKSAPLIFPLKYFSNPNFSKTILMVVILAEEATINLIPFS